MLSPADTRFVIRTITRELPWLAYVEGRLPAGKTAHVRDWYRHRQYLGMLAKPVHPLDAVWQSGTDQLVRLKPPGDAMFDFGGPCYCRVCRRAERARWRRVQKHGQ